MKTPKCLLSLLHTLWEGFSLSLFFFPLYSIKAGHLYIYFLYLEWLAIFGYSLQVVGLGVQLLLFFLLHCYGVQFPILFGLWVCRKVGKILGYALLDQKIMMSENSKRSRGSVKLGLTSWSLDVYWDLQ